MKNFLLNNSLTDVWKEAKTPLDYLLALVISALTALALTGIGKMLFELITNPSQFDNTSYGIFDYI
jgi:hypothetical protein